MKNPFYKLQNEGAVPVLTINGIIGKDSDYAGLRNSLLTLIAGGMKRMKMVINSGGGSMIEGFAMFDLLVSSGITIEVEIIGMAASMAGIFSQAASPGLLGIHSNACIMVHKPQVGASSGESDQLRSTADFADKLEARAIKIYANRTGKPEAEIKKWFASGVQKWFTAEEAVAAGLADYIISDSKQRPASVANETEAWKFYNSISTENSKSKIMNKLLMSVVLMLNNAGITTVNAESTEDDVIKALNAFNVSNTAKIAELNNTISAHGKTRAADLITAAITAGKLLNLDEAAKTKWIARAEKDYDSVSELLNMAVVTTPDINAQLERSNKSTSTSTSSVTNDATKKDRKDWTMLDYEKNDPEAVKNMMVNDRANYVKLFKAEYGIDPFA